MSKLYGVGVGPGDPELLTLKAARILREVPVIAYPACAPGASSYAYQIVERLLDPARQRPLGLVFPMTKDREELEVHWRASVEAVLAELRAGRDVAFITEGDPFFYSTFIHLWEIFRAHCPEVSVEVVPGVSSLTASSVAAELPLASQDERVAVLPATYEEKGLREALQRFDTVVLMKVSSSYDRVLDLLEETGLKDRAVFVKKVGAPDEEVVRDLESLRGKKLSYLSTLLVVKNAVPTAPGAAPAARGGLEEGEP
ncbi:MAG: precorrin-2 C(20)-methyltransferase [Nitrospinota bacterium]